VSDELLGFGLAFENNRAVDVEASKRMRERSSAHLRVIPLVGKLSDPVKSGQRIARLMSL
jgi:hypothetical protein